MAASVARGWCCLAIIGRMARVLISRPIQANSQWWLVMVIIVPVAMVQMRIVHVVGLISIGGG